MCTFRLQLQADRGQRRQPFNDTDPLIKSFPIPGRRRATAKGAASARMGQSHREHAGSKAEHLRHLHRAKYNIYSAITFPLTGKLPHRKWQMSILEEHIGIRHQPDHGDLAQAPIQFAWMKKHMLVESVVDVQLLN